MYTFWGDGCQSRRFSFQSHGPGLERGPLGGRRLQHGGFKQLGLEEPFATRAVKKNLVAIGFPDSGELGCTGAVQAEVDSAGFAASQQYPLGQGENSHLELVMIANDGVDVVSEFMDAFDLIKTSQHCCYKSPVIYAEHWKEGGSTWHEQLGGNADKENYRQYTARSSPEYFG